VVHRRWRPRAALRAGARVARPPGLSAPCRFRRPVGYDHDDEHGPPHFEVSPPNPFRAVWKTAEVEARAAGRCETSPRRPAGSYR
jgi:hypothetical protein